LAKIERKLPATKKRNGAGLWLLHRYQRRVRHVGDLFVLAEQWSSNHICRVSSRKTKQRYGDVLENKTFVSSQAFQNLAATDLPVCVACSSDAQGYPIPRDYCLYIPNAQGVDMKDGTGRIFFASSRPEAELKQLLDVQRQQ